MSAADDLIFAILLMVFIGAGCFIAAGIISGGEP